MNEGLQSRFTVEHKDGEEMCTVTFAADPTWFGDGRRGSAPLSVCVRYEDGIEADIEARYGDWLALAMETFGKEKIPMDEKDIEQRLTRVEERSKSNSHRLDEHEKRLQDNEKMLQSIALIAQKQERMDSDMAEIKTDVKSLLGKPEKRWEKIVEAAIAAIVGGLIAFALFKLGLGK